MIIVIWWWRKKNKYCPAKPVIIAILLVELNEIFFSVLVAHYHPDTLSLTHSLVQIEIPSHITHGWIIADIQHWTTILLLKINRQWIWIWRWGSCFDSHRNPSQILAFSLQNCLETAWRWRRFGEKEGKQNRMKKINKTVKYDGMAGHVNQFYSSPLV